MRSICILDNLVWVAAYSSSSFSSESQHFAYLPSSTQLHASNVADLTSSFKKGNANYFKPYSLLVIGLGMGKGPASDHWDVRSAREASGKSFLAPKRHKRQAFFPLTLLYLELPELLQTACCREVSLGHREAKQHWIVAGFLVTVLSSWRHLFNACQQFLFGVTHSRKCPDTEFSKCKWRYYNRP